MNGIVIVDKPSGWTSQDVTARLRRVFNTRRIGHGGTLDPMATGVLPVFVGRATRGVEFFEHAQKVYETVIQLGITTDTEDTTGTVLTSCDPQVTPGELEAVLPRFRGEIMQVPPMYSALKIGGQKLCDLARQGREVERKPRPITIHELTLLGQTPEGFRLRVRCSKGTYIRTLCKDIGQALGCGGCMAQLRRVAAGNYSIEEAVSLEELLEAQNPEAYLRPVDSMFRGCEAVTLTANQEKRCRNGNAFSIALPDGTYRAYSQSGEFLMLAQVEGGVMSTIKSFFEV
ncbi:MAG: tRNA pseudouridine(55) synthase TruB [Faecousia sp.]